MEKLTNEKMEKIFVSKEKKFYRFGSRGQTMSDILLLPNEGTIIKKREKFFLLLFFILKLSYSQITILLVI